MHVPRPTAGSARTAPAGLPMTGSARVALALAVTMIVGLLGGTSGSGTAGALPADAVTRVIVQATEDLGATTSAVVARGGRVLDVISPLGMVGLARRGDRPGPTRPRPP